MSVRRTILMYPIPFSSIRSKSSVSNDFSPKNKSPPCCSNATIRRKIAPVEAGEIRPYSSENSSFPSFVAYCNIFLKSFKSNKGSLLSSQYLNMTEIIPAWVSLTSKIRDNSTGPNSLTVARRRTPFCCERVKISTGKFFAVKGIPIFSWRSSIFSCPGLGSAIPLRSPFISINKTGTPFSERFSANTCNDFVFPVPVAPAIRP